MDKHALQVFARHGKDLTDFFCGKFRCCSWALLRLSQCLHQCVNVSRLHFKSFDVLRTLFPFAPESMSMMLPLSTTNCGLFPLGIMSLSSVCCCFDSSIFWVCRELIYTATVRKMVVAQICIFAWISIPNSTALIYRPITISCINSLLEKQIVRPVNRLILVLKSRFFRSIFCVFFFPTSCSLESRFRS